MVVAGGENNNLLMRRWRRLLLVLPQLQRLLRVQCVSSTVVVGAHAHSVVHSLSAQREN